MIKMLIRVIFGAHIPYQAKIGKGTILGDEGFCIAIHPRAVIGENCTIMAQVLIGGTSHKYEVAQIGNNVVIGAGAKIIGPVIIGDNCVVGANSVVVKDIPPNCLAVGIPARIIKEHIDIKDYI